MPEPEYLTVDHLSTKEITRLFSNIIVDPITECWNWQAYCNPDGYGRFNFRGRLESVHRLLYAWLVGPLPRGSKHNVPHLDHEVCDNPPCANPHHTRLKSHTANVMRGSSPSAVNAHKTHCANGHLLPTQKDNRHSRQCKTCYQLADVRRNQTENRKAYKHKAYLARKRTRTKQAT